jgi:hypothetical protein
MLCQTAGYIIDNSSFLWRAVTMLTGVSNAVMTHLWQCNRKARQDKCDSLQFCCAR